MVVKIDTNVLRDLLESKARLDALEQYGVDNWCGYCDAFEHYLEEYEDFDEYIDDEYSDEILAEKYGVVEEQNK